MGFTAKSYLKTQFENFANRIELAFAKKEHYHVTTLTCTANTSYGTNQYTSSAKTAYLTQINERIRINKAIPTFQWITVATITEGKPSGTRRLNVIADDGGNVVSGINIACQITTAGAIQITSSADLNGKYITIEGGYRNPSK